MTLAAALALSGGVALFLFGHCCFRWALGLPCPWLRLTGAVAALATAPIGMTWAAWGHLTLLLITSAFVAADDTLVRRPLMNKATVPSSADDCPRPLFCGGWSQSS
ncbi:hypothetical protein [Nonomuraea turcica]|uniref:hypothetical protein n=1 Tax=Nonomuraea sp. G32 TaxID=3067274 RepID=UPI00273A8F1C|nr:hypothetical protein [Nonomuraea sp. G32]MDP4504899.1 hypothetical protein [Nonomuraea sp. G32]